MHDAWTRFIAPLRRAEAPYGAGNYVVYSFQTELVRTSGGMWCKSR